MISLKRHSSKVIFIFFLAFYIPVISVCQRYSRIKSNNVFKSWAFESQVGVLSYFGDLSIYDSDISNKIINESGPSLGASITKYFGNNFGIGGEIIGGKIKATKNEQSFESMIFEYNGQIQLDALNLIMQEKQLNVGIILFAGIGNIMFNSEYKNQITTTSYSTKVPEFLYFVGGKIEYHPSIKLKLSASATIRQLQNDNLDATSQNVDYDYYSYVNFGLAYKLNKKTKRSGNSRLNSIKRRR